MSKRVCLSHAYVHVYPLTPPAHARARTCIRPARTRMQGSGCQASGWPVIDHWPVIMLKDSRPVLGTTPFVCTYSPTLEHPIKEGHAHTYMHPECIHVCLLLLLIFCLNLCASLVMGASLGGRRLRLTSGCGRTCTPPTFQNALTLAAYSISRSLLRTAGSVHVLPEPVVDLVHLDIDEAGLGHQSLHLGAEQRPEGAHELAR